VEVGNGTSERDVGTAPSERSEFTPDTSFASQDDNDWTEEYDRHATDYPLDEMASLEVCVCVGGGAGYVGYSENFHKIVIMTLIICCICAFKGFNLIQS